MAKKQAVPAYELYDLTADSAPPQQAQMEIAAPALPRTHRVMANLLHADSLTHNKSVMLTRGDEVTFGPEIDDEQIQSLIDAGVLDGPRARELLRELIVTEATEEMQGMSKEMLLDIWKAHLRRSRSATVASERAEARVKEDGAGAQRANMDEAEANDPLTRAAADMA